MTLWVQPVVFAGIVVTMTVCFIRLISKKRREGLLENENL